MLSRTCGFVALRKELRLNDGAGVAAGAVKVSADRSASAVGRRRLVRGLVVTDAGAAGLPPGTALAAELLGLVGEA